MSFIMPFRHCFHTCVLCLSYSLFLFSGFVDCLLFWNPIGGVRRLVPISISCSSVVLVVLSIIWSSPYVLDDLCLAEFEFNLLEYSLLLFQKMNRIFINRWSFIWNFILSLVSFIYAREHMSQTTRAGCRSLLGRVAVGRFRCPSHRSWRKH